ncbi:helix-turn-helix transcriptional regulator [Phycisphaerales bacterium AB-hyl4]|uniref:Helix-turn-helix transcriptional regulator n=1 Tax=Natronomicrosphaera hydrolytica TaxID=3242702 RepID=A0ABV4U5P6_9BACT
MNRREGTLPQRGPSGGRRPSGEDAPANGRLVSLKTLAEMWDADRSTVRRWLKAADIEPVAIGRGRNGAIWYRWHEIEAWLDSLEHVE